MIALCTECFPDDGTVYRYSMHAISPCVQCGRWHGRDKATPTGLCVLLYPEDPRKQKEAA